MTTPNDPQAPGPDERPTDAGVTRPDTPAPTPAVGEATTQISTPKAEATPAASTTDDAAQAAPQQPASAQAGAPAAADASADQTQTVQYGTPQGQQFPGAPQPGGAPQYGVPGQPVPGQQFGVPGQPAPGQQFGVPGQNPYAAPQNQGYGAPQYGAPQGAPQSGAFGAPGNATQTYHGGPDQPGAQVPGQSQFGQQTPIAQQQFGQQPFDQFGQQNPAQFGQQPFDQGQYNQPAGDAAGQSSKIKFVIFGVIGVVVIAAIVLITAFLWPGWAGKTLSQDAVEQGVVKVLTAANPTEGYNLKNVKDVQCPSGQEVKAGHTFTCSLKVEGQNKHVTVTIKDDSGTYEVSRPTN
ncbi:MAG: DUF4333 domain-containing protein [Gordonia sp. (in: high G+C Gram-positive bacteria)]